MTNSTLWRPRPIFITSTFRDMQAERDYLRDHVFPILDERLRQRREYLEPIDLRQGVETLSEGEAITRELEVLKVCLDEVRRSQPFLIGLLGDRYGWVPPLDRMKAAAEEIGFTGEVAGFSITELEIAYGALADNEQRHRSRFYFRKSLPCEAMDREAILAYSRANEPESRSGTNQARLAALKTRIKSMLPDRWRDYQAVWDSARQQVSGLEEWGRQVVEDIWADLMAESRDGALVTPKTWQDTQRWVLEQFIEDHARGFVGRSALLAQIAAFADSPVAEDVPWGLCVTGQAGSGKSALFARVSRDFEESHGQAVLTLFHSAGTSPRAAHVDDLLARWIEELAQSIGVQNPLGDEAGSEQIEQTFSELLSRASMHQRVVLLIDALDQLEATPRAQRLTWLQSMWPPNARLVVTGLDCTAVRSFTARTGVESVVLGSLTDDEAGELAESIYVRYHRLINPAVRTVLLAKLRSVGEPAHGNPLWLEMAVEALNTLDADDFARAERDYAEELDPARRLQRLSLDLIAEMPGEVDALYGWLLARAEKLHGESFVRAIVGLIAVSRMGWREQDFAVLVPELSTLQWDALEFAALRRTLRTHLLQRGPQGQWAFAHQQLRRAALARGLAEGETVRQLHQTLSDYLENLPPSDPLHETETMVHLIGADAAHRAACYYAGERTDAELAGATEALVSQIHVGIDIHDISGLKWVVGLIESVDLGERTRADLCRRYLFDLNNALADSPLGVRLQLLEAVRRILEHLTTEYPDEALWRRDFGVSHFQIGDILALQGNVSGALGAYLANYDVVTRLVEEDPDNMEWCRDLAVNRMKVGDMLTNQGELAGALISYRVALEVTEKMTKQDPANQSWLRDLGSSHERLGDVLNIQGDLSGAFASYSTAREIAERVVAKDCNNLHWQRDLSVSHNKVGDVLLARGDLAAALTAYRASLEIREQLTNQNPARGEWIRDLSTSHSKLGDVLSALGDLPGALANYQASHDIVEQLAQQDPGNAEWQRDLSICHIKVGDMLSAQGDVANATQAYRSAVQITEGLAGRDPSNTHWQRVHSVGLLKLGDMFRFQGDLEGALAAHRTSLEVNEKLADLDPTNTLWQRDLAISRDRIGELAAVQGDLAAALASFHNALDVRERLGASDPENVEWQRDLAVGHTQLGDTLRASDDLPGALGAYQTAHAIIARLNERFPDNTEWQRDVAVSHDKMGDVLSLQGALPSARGAFLASRRIRERLSARDPSNATWQRDLAVSFYKLTVVANQEGSTEMANENGLKCYEVLSAMHHAGVTLDPTMEQLLIQLHGIFGGGETSA